MLTLNSILKELKNVPEDRLDDLYSIIRSLHSNKKRLNKSNNKILSFAGSFKNMSKKDYDDFLGHINQTRNNLFDREINL